ncbi:MAG: FkbM family methyltransferase, partial [Selenomonadaceae bacterium]|nr:FkbM family methyltransferase [Selenomonadaceae bacterium]
SAIVCALENIFDDKYINNLRSLFTNDYLVLDVGGVNFLINSRYDVMLNPFLQGETFQQDDIILYFELVKKYYGLDTKDFNGKWFFDIGANIGSTSIWANKKICPDMKIAAFEPVEENCRQFLCNLALNSIPPDSVILTRAALSSENGVGEIMHSSCDNFGDCRVVKNGNRDLLRTTEQIRTIRLDDWISDKNISPNDVACVWMDVQAHEGFVLDGGMKFFSENRFPLITEIWPNGLRANDSLELTIERITALYDKFICVDYYQEDNAVYDISGLKDFIQNCSLDYFDIFLIK